MRQEQAIGHALSGSLVLLATLLDGHSYSHIVGWQVLIVWYVYFAVPWVATVCGTHPVYDLNEYVDAHTDAIHMNAVPCSVETQGRKLWQYRRREETRRFYESWRMGFLVPSEATLAWAWGRFW